MDEKQFTELSSKLDAILTLLAADFLAGKSKTDAMLLLANSGMSNKEIARITGSTPNTVNVTKIRSKKIKRK